MQNIFGRALSYPSLPPPGAATGIVPCARESLASRGTPPLTKIMQRRTHPALSFPSFVTILHLCPPPRSLPRESPPVVLFLPRSFSLTLFSSFSSPRHGSSTKIKIMVPATPAGIFLLLRSAFSACAPSARQRQPACKSCATGFLSPFGERQKKERGEVRHGLLSRYTGTVR